MAKQKSKTKEKYKSFFKEAGKILAPERMNRAKQKAKKTIQQIQLSELRNQLGIKQTELKDFTQSNVSRLESRADMKISTLIDYIHNLGMEIEIKVRPMGKSSKKEEVLLLKG